MSVELSTDEIKILIESLNHCLETCQNKGKPCADCDSVKSLLQKLQATKA